MGAQGFAVAVVIGVAMAVWFRRRRLGSFRASQRIGDGVTSVRLVAGPWAGQTVKVDGVPAPGSELQSWTAGLVGDDIHRGHYVVTDVSPELHTAVGSWRLDS